MNILGINAYHGDASACALVDGVLEAAIEEERLRRVKHWAGFPAEAVRACLAQTGLRPQDIDHVAVGRSPSANFHRKIGYALRRRPRLSLIRDRLANLGRFGDLRTTLCEGLDVDPGSFTARFHGVEHHLAHLASSFYGSPFDTAVGVSIDGFGDFASTLWGVGTGSRIHAVQRVLFPHSLGAFYTAGTQFLGFDRFGDEYKVMGLAPYGEPEHLPAMRELIRPKGRGKFRLDLRHFRHPYHVVDTRWDGCAPETAPYFSDEWSRRFGAPRRSGEPLEARHANIARSLQTAFEEVYFHVLEHAATLRPGADLVLAGGCAANAVANGKILGRTDFRRLHVHAAAGDAGTAVGAAMWVWHQTLGRPRVTAREHPFLGPEYGSGEIRRALESASLRFDWLEDPEALIRTTVERLVSGDVVGWFQGRSEWGPRALGNRSILADPRRPGMRDVLNGRIKQREEFRPFAPAVLEERAGEFFDGCQPSPFMNQVYPVRHARREQLGAVTHVDGTARVQTVARSGSALFHGLIAAFGERTGVPVLLNTSFNENEPIVHTPREAIDCFLRTGLDVLVIGPALVRRPVASA